MEKIYPQVLKAMRENNGKIGHLCVQASGKVRDQKGRLKKKYMCWQYDKVEV
jgi:hypothetical protein